ncbi:MAG: CHASE sensor domain-containing protein, partial [Verrucomicrobiota bacterium]|nr:CHASE sensor domain-containing protein [Verrucomicrobiota bacterium]
MSGKARNPRIWFNNLPLSRKILSITFVSSLITLFLLCSLSFLRDRHYFYDRKISSLKTLARILESNTTAALCLDDPDIARQYVSSLSEEPDIERVTIFDAADKVFAAYNRTQDLVEMPPPTTLGVSMDKDYILIAHEVTFGEERLGTILIEISTRSLHNSVLNLLWTNIAFLFGGLAITTALAYRLQKFITTPINELVEVTKSIASEQDYSTKALKHSDDEIGSLVDSVNQMLEAIEKRDETLRSTNSILEKTVEKRTRDLNERNKALNKAI